MQNNNSLLGIISSDKYPYRFCERKLLLVFSACDDKVLPSGSICTLDRLLKVMLVMSYCSECLQVIPSGTFRKILRFGTTNKSPVEACETSGEASGAVVCRSGIKEDNQPYR
jgi:hypothetical protein